MSDWLETLLTMAFVLAICIGIGIAVYHFLPGAATNWITTQINSIFNFGSNAINNSMS
jgi:hypothetical protein